LKDLSSGSQNETNTSNLLLKLLSIDWHHKVKYGSLNALLLKKPLAIKILNLNPNFICDLIFQLG